MRTAWLIAVKDLRLLGRDPVALFWVLGFPVLFAVFFGSVMKAGASDEAAPWPVAVVDEVGTDASRELVRALGASGSLAIEQPGESEARGRVERGEAIARVALRAGGVEIGVDPKRRVEGTLLARLVEGALVEARPPSRPAAALSPDVAQLPRPAPPRVEVRELTARATAPHSAYEVVFAAALLWGLMGCAAAFAVSFVTERASGTLVRLSAAPVGRGAIVGGKALACGIACTADALLLWGFSRVALGVQVPSPLLFLAALLSTVACFVGITMTLAGLGKTEQAVAGAGWSTLIVMAMLGGAMVPRYLLPAWLQSVGLVSPVHWGIRALEAASFRGLGAAELVVPCAVLLGTGLAGFAGGLVLLRRAG